MTKLVLCASLLVTASSVSVAALANEPAAATAVKTTAAVKSPKNTASSKPIRVLPVPVPVSPHAKAELTGVPVSPAQEKAAAKKKVQVIKDGAQVGVDTEPVKAIPKEPDIFNDKRNAIPNHPNNTPKAK